MYSLLLSCPSFTLWRSESLANNYLTPLPRRRRLRNGPTRAFFLNPAEEPVLKEALKEPVAFLGGMFAGLLRLDMNDDPLKEWIKRTVEAAGITEEEIGTEEESKADDDLPQQIEID
ncbi:hypothetical protein Nepgr_019282 [Nepenthes gracilis]|uniref:Uncharacterized protein n=1 Tax=Nepenthes gracilis TaxID=150966 RepID=A0AAD3SUY4_NEPGR|nr:hypothetical protein Nepgr_019282 [Nepenthes gracilis]